MAGDVDVRSDGFSWLRAKENRPGSLRVKLGFAYDTYQQDSLYYIGHSQGTVIMFDRLSEDPDFGKKVSTNKTF